MAVTNAFKEAVANGATNRVRIMMKDSLIRERTFTEYEEMVAAAAGMPGLFEPDDGDWSKAPQSEWNKEYLSLLTVRLLSNFSKERIAHLKEVIRYLYPATPKPAASPEAHRTAAPRPNPASRPDSRSYQERVAQAKQNGTYLGSKNSVVSTIAGAAVGAIGAAIVSTGTAAIGTGAVIGAVAGAGIGYVLYQGKGEK